MFGIELRIDPTWLFLLVLLVWNLSLLFRQWHSAWSSVTILATALVAALLFFASIVAHELAHALVAKRFGIPVRNITLFLFGGVSNIEREPSSPRAEALMAVVGPAVSIGIGFVLGAATWLLARATLAPLAPAESPAEWISQFGPTLTLLTWLASVNFGLGLFNLIPGFPLDGGRVLRAVIWGITGDLHQGTRWASLVGQFVGWGFVVFGVFRVFGVVGHGPNVFGGMWLAFIGWFLASAAANAYRGLLLSEALEGVPVWRLMRKTMYPMLPATTLEVAMGDWFMRSDERAFPVVREDGEFVGLICLDDLRKTPREEWPQTAVDQVMTRRESLVSTSPHEDVSVALRHLSERDVGQLPVLERGALVGLLERRDVARWLELHLGTGFAPRAS